MEARRSFGATTIENSFRGLRWHNIARRASDNHYLAFLLQYQFFLFC